MVLYYYINLLKDLYVKSNLINNNPCVLKLCTKIQGKSIRFITKIDNYEYCQIFNLNKTPTLVRWMLSYQNQFIEGLRICNKIYVLYTFFSVNIFVVQPMQIRYRPTLSCPVRITQVGNLNFKSIS